MRDKHLWLRLKEHNLDFEGGEFPFSKRLARDNGWTQHFAQQTIEEYKKFIYLCVVSGREMTPSDEVDQVWHLHLTYTRDYWGAFREVLGADLHHGPTKGGVEEGARYLDNYESTLRHYQQEFGEAPPQDQWPPAARRFGDAPFMQRVNIRSLPAKRSLSLKWPVAALASGLVLNAAVSAQEQNGLSSLVERAQTNPVMSITVVASLALGIFLILAGKVARGKSKNEAASCGGAASSGGKAAGQSDGGPADGGGDGGCGGGCGGCGG